jgi:hypothetical protein
MSKIEVNAIEPQCGTNLTVGASGDTITFPSGTTVVNNGSQTGFGRTGTVDWDTTAKTASFTAVSGNGYFVNTTSGAVTMTLPATPSAGDIVSVKDYAYTFATNNLTVNRNGSPIGGGSDINTIDYSTNGDFLTFIYVDGTQGWVLTNDSTNTDNTAAQYITATGGTITCCGDYKIHTFTGPGTFTVCSVGNPAGSTTIDYLVVAGGGGGGSGNSGSGSGGGGGGAGGWRASSGTASGCYTAGPGPLTSPVSALPVTAQGYPITVGAGGAGSSSCSNCRGSNGVNSVFSTITSAGGGGGGTRVLAPIAPAANGNPGGSGGGASNMCGARGTAGAGNTPPVSPPQGNDGAQNNVCNGNGGGGGGAVAVAAATPISAGGTGGTGATSCITASPVAYAGGGGGGGAPAGGPGGTGGGGNGSPGSAGGTDGTTNTGGGGGGGKGASFSGLTGGSGIVIIRYKFQ